MVVSEARSGESATVPSDRPVSPSARSVNVGSARRFGWTRAVRACLLAGVPGAVVGAATIAFIYQLVYVYYLLSPEGAQSTQAARDLGAGVWPQIFLGTGVLVAAFVSGYFGGWRPALLGLVCGSAAVATEQTIILLGYPPVLPAELAGFAVFGLSSGLLGGLAGGRAARRTVASEKASYRAVREMARAKDANAVAASIAGVLGGEEPAGVGVWARAHGPAEGVGLGEADGTWRSGSKRPFSPCRLLRSVGENGVHLPGRGRPLSSRRLAEASREEWRAQGVGSVFVAPLLSSGGESSGLLLVAYPTAGRAGRLWAAWRVRRRLLSVAAQGLMALENLELARKKEASDMRAGAVQERVRWARDVHDSLIQCLAGVIRELDTARKAERLGVPETASEARASAHDAAREAITEARRLIHGMRPEALENSALPEALSATARRVMDGSGVRLVCEVDGEARSLPEETGHAVLRICQEALQNVRKHSGASRAVVALRYRADRVLLEVSDDGVGLDGKTDAYGGRRSHDGAAPDDRDGGFGLGSMRGRAEDLGGRLRLENAVGGIGGARVVAELPDTVQRSAGPIR